MWDWTGETTANDIAMLDVGLSNFTNILVSQGLTVGDFDDFLRDVAQTMGLPNWMDPNVAFWTGIPGDQRLVFGAGGTPEDDVIVVRASVTGSHVDGHGVWWDGSIPFSSRDGDAFDEVAIVATVTAILAGGRAGAVIGTIAGLLWVADNNPDWFRETAGG